MEKVMMTKKTMIILTVLTVFSISGNAQGCSDAGFCTIHSIKNNTGSGGNNDKNNELVAGFVFGKGERSTSYYTWEVEYTRLLGLRTSVTGKIGYSFINGEL